MSTPIDQALEPHADTEEASSTPTTTRVRRFAPKRSRSAALPVATEPENPVPEAAAPPPLLTAANSKDQDAGNGVTSATLEGAAPTVPPSAKAPRPRPSRSRRNPTPAAATRAADSSNTVPVVAEIDLVAANAVATESGDVPPADVAPSEMRAATTPAGRTARRRSGRRPPAVAEEQSDSAIAPAGDIIPPTIDARIDSASGDATAASVDLDTTGPTPEISAPTASTRPSRSRRHPARSTPDVPAQPVSSTAPAPPGNEAQEDDPRRDPYDGWRMDSDILERAPGGDLDSTEALARALLEMFPIVEAETSVEPVAAAGASAEATDVAPAEEVAESAGPNVAELDEEDQASDEPSRRRGRRGRRGGRGRRRGVTLAAAEPDDDAGEQPLAAVDVESTAEPPVQLFVPPAMPAVPETSDARFTPGPQLQPERSWRDRGPQRRWNRTFPRDTQPIVMPPPKPSNGARFAAIPQATAPRPQLAVSDVAARGVSPFVMPDLRVDEPLAPGESRTERLLDVQNRLLQAMLEGQARQIEVLTATVSNVQAAVRDISSNAGSRAYQPRTGIFVDAPNVCYAAENARVTLDFGRMLKYLTRDRHLVHALSYSPIIDDVREGIRYETQRFVAPFLRSGYKLITKPLKRFSDGSAKGNFDIELALDIITMAERLDVVVLVSGDSDFESVIQHIQSRGVRVEVVAFASNVSTELVNVADTFLDIGQHLEHFRAE